MRFTCGTFHSWWMYSFMLFLLAYSFVSSHLPAIQHKPLHTSWITLHTNTHTHKEFLSSFNSCWCKHCSGTVMESWNSCSYKILIICLSNLLTAYLCKVHRRRWLVLCVIHTKNKRFHNDRLILEKLMVAKMIWMQDAFWGLIICNIKIKLDDCQQWLWVWIHQEMHVE